MPTYSIKDLFNLTGIQAHTIRVWEQRFGLLSPERTSTNFRVYSDKDLRKLLSVALLNRNGLKISKIANLSDIEIAEAVLQLSEVADSKLESHIESLKLIMVEMNEVQFEKWFNHIVLHMGFEEAILHVFIPFFKRLIFLWQTNAVTVAQINFVTSLYRQKLYVAIDGLAPSNKENTKKVILFLPQTEHLEHGLLFCNYMAKKRGFQTLYLGDSFLAEEISVVIQKNPDCYLVSVASLAQIDLSAYYTQVLASCSDNSKLLLTGSQISTVKIADPRLTVFQDYEGLKEYLEQM